MVEFVYPPVIAAARSAFRLLDVRVGVEGGHRVPRVGGAVLASTHVSYLDFLFVGYAGLPARRLVRFMAKDEVFRHPVSGPLMRGMRHIPVDRAAGAAAYDAALAALGRGEVVGVFPEATISRSFTVKELKTGAARLALASGTPLLPVVTWGGQRLWTKGRPRVLRRHVPVTVAVGEPVVPGPGDDPASLTAALAVRLGGLLEAVQDAYPDRPDPGEDPWWLPVRLGGTAPTPEAARAMDAAERADRAARRAPTPS